MPDQGKYCTKCGKWNYYQDYFKDRTRPSGYRSHCKKCCKAQADNYRANNRGKIQLAVKRYRATRKGRYSIQQTNLWQRTFRDEQKRQARKAYDARYYQNRKRLKQEEVA